MTRLSAVLELPLRDRRSDQALGDWLYAELRHAMLTGRLPPGTRLPATRDFARQYGISRGTVVVAFERLLAEGYLAARAGAGTWVSDGVPIVHGRQRKATSTPLAVRRAIASYERPRPFAGLGPPAVRRPFQMRNPAVAEFPVAVWRRLAARRARQFSDWLSHDDDGRGYRPLREAIASYLETSRGASCRADQIVITSGAQQALDLLARVLLRPGDEVSVEDPGYFGAELAFGNARATVVPVPVDEHGFSVSAAARTGARPVLVYVTPAHQFPLGMTMSLERRTDLLAWVRRTDACIVEDDYDSEFRFDGRPVPVLQGLDPDRVVLIGSFSKVLFPGLRIGYIVLPHALTDCFVAFRMQTDFRAAGIDQAVLCDFIVNGHLARHIRRMRDVYASRLGALLDAGGRDLGGLLRIAPVRAGLYTAGFLENGMTSTQAEAAAAAHGIDAVGLHRYAIDVPDPRGVLLGFAAFDEASIRHAVTGLAHALRRQRHRNARRA